MNRFVRHRINGSRFRTVATPEASLASLSAVAAQLPGELPNGDLPLRRLARVSPPAVRHYDGYWSLASKTMRTARSITSGENFGDFLMWLHSQSKEPPSSPRRRHVTGDGRTLTDTGLPSPLSIRGGRKAAGPVTTPQRWTKTQPTVPTGSADSLGRLFMPAACRCCRTAMAPDQGRSGKSGEPGHSLPTALRHRSTGRLREGLL